MKIYLLNLLLFCLFGVLLLSACQQSPMPANNVADKKGVEVKDAAKQTVAVNDSSRIVSIGTAVTETIYALGAGERVVAVDNASGEYIKESSGLPKVGARNQLSAEGILSLKPSLVVLTSDSQPQTAIDQIKAAGITVLTLPADYNVEAVKAKVNTIAQALGAPEKGEMLANSIDSEMQTVTKMLEKAESKPKVLFVGRGPNMPNATMSGTGTTIDEMIRLAGGTNPMADFQGFREMTDEAVGKAAPDVILMTEKSFERSGGVDGVLKFPGVMLTPAGKNKRVVAVSDMYFQGFGPGVGRAVRELAVKLHPELAGVLAQ